MTRPTSVLLFAAGFGTRMAPLTDTQPKPLIEVAGRPLLDHGRTFCDGLQVVVNTHYLADQIRDYLSGSNALISHEKGAPLETGGGLKHALPLMGQGPVFTMNTDAVWRGENPIEALSKEWRPKMEALLLMIPTGRAIGHNGKGDFDIGPDGRLTEGTGYVYSGVQIICTDGLMHITEDSFSIWSLWAGMLERKSMYGLAYDGEWCDVGRPESIPLAEAMLKSSDDV